MVDSDSADVLLGRLSARLRLVCRSRSMRTGPAVLASVPFWFHTFALNQELGLYTPGEARDHGYRLASIPDSFQGLSVLDVGAFDGFYSFLAEARGATRVLAVDNEQYVHWVRDRWAVELEGGEGFAAIHGLLGSKVEYRRTDAFALDEIEERFDFIFCFGILHRVENPFELLHILASRLTEGGRILIETYGVLDDDGRRRHSPRTCPRHGLPERQLRLLAVLEQRCHQPRSLRQLNLRATRHTAHRRASPHHRRHQRYLSRSVWGK